ncbi:MAG: hypothetical protein LBM56_02295 [Burkholderiaceae bacterium]|jgi:multidrug efflux pump subunit AcrA (membrane-fusion protein)|nr:hypothetical protein [Burkholderiaceae bacterium]
MREGKSTVMTVDKQNRVAVRQVATGRYTSTVVEILSGLTTDDRVILNPNALIRPGDTVTAETPKSSHK